MYNYYSGNMTVEKKYDYGGWIWRNEFPEEELTRIRGYANKLSFNRGTVGENLLVDNKFRTAQTAWIPVNDETKWLYDKIHGLMHSTNNKQYHLDLEGSELIQYSRYYAPRPSKLINQLKPGKKEVSVGDYYDWHQDTSTGYVTQRKLSMSLLISNPETDFLGGEFQLFDYNGLNGPNALNYGEAICFPSWVFHKVFPVKKGLRESLVCWLSGRPIR